MRRVVCLAASLKHGGFCYAGKDIDTKQWVRPIGADPGHGISRYFAMVGKGDQAAVGDILSMKLGAAINGGYQTENVQHIEEHWRRLSTATFDQLQAMIDRPPSLWGEGRSSKHGLWDDLTEAQANQFDYSLCLIEVNDLIIVCSDEGYGEVKLRTRARFSYNGVRHLLSITDPAHFNYEQGDHPIGHALLSCSLTEPYSWSDGSRHVSKLVAAIITRGRLG